MALLTIISGLILLLALYCAVDPFKHSAISDFPDFKAHTVEMPPWSEVPVARDSQNLLQKSELKFLTKFKALRVWLLILWAVGRMLALLMEGSCSGTARLGLILLTRTPIGGLATVLVNEAEGVPFRFTNDLDVDDDGNVYFTDSSSSYQRRNFMQLVFAAEDSGRVLKYRPITKQATVLFRNLQFPNGLSLSKDQSFFLFCEGAPGRLRRYWLKGEQAGTSDIFAILPGFPDNTRTNDNGKFWMAVPCRCSMFNHICGLYPTFRNFLPKLPIPPKYQYLLLVGGRPHAAVVKYSSEGKLLQILEDSEGKVVKAVSEVEERDGKLWTGSVFMPFVAVYQLP